MAHSGARSSIALLACFFSFSGMTGCGQVATGEAALDLACDRFAAARVGFYSACGVAPAPVGPTRASCMGIATAPGTGVTAADVDRCAQEIEERAPRCGALLPTCVGAEPNLLFPLHDHPGSLADGSVCSLDTQCTSARCEHEGYDLCGVCRTLRAEGETCDPARDSCRPYYENTLPYPCTGAVCDLPGRDEGESCNPDVGYCHEGLYCTDDGFCLALVNLGGPCRDLAADCEQNTRCVAGTCTLSIEDGQPCAHDEDCFFGHCEEGLCRAQGVVSPPVASPCGGGPACAADSSCQGFCGGDDPCPSCVRTLPGDPCTRELSCSAGSTCVLSDDPSLPNLCALREGIGAPCPCLADSWCGPAGTCIAYGTEQCH